MAADETGGKSKDDLSIAMFVAAMSLPEAEREPFLREACAGDDALFAEAQRRVEWEGRLNGFLLTPVAPRERMDRPFALGERILRRFQIIRVAGEGGMGVVYEAQDEKLGNRIALKCPRFEFRRRLSPEAVNSLRVTHPNVCRVFEIHTAETSTGDVDFLTMEFLEGETLAARLPHAPARWLGTAEGAKLARQICGGLQAVHDQGVIHRDLKSNNVMLSADPAGRPRAVIMDFGIANSGDVFSSQTRGTPAYIAPELWKGQPASPQSDIYALGVLLYEMACGCKPFPDTASWKERLKSAPPIPAVRESVRSAILRCLNPDPARRFQSAAEVGAALGQGWWSRRLMLTGLAGAASAGLAGAFVKEQWWPTSAVRLVILPPVIEGAIGDVALIRGFVSFLSYRLKTIRAVRRPLSVTSLAEADLAGLKTAIEAETGLGATHTISSAFRRNGDDWSVTVELLDVAGSGSSPRLDRKSTTADLAAMLFSLQSDVFKITAEQLALRGEPRAQTLSRNAYADYWRGLYFARVEYDRAAEGIPYFQKVIDAAPDSALGHAGMAEALLGVRLASKDRSFEGKALTALAKAEQFDPYAAPVQLISGRLSLAAGQYERALRDLQRAAELDPNDAQAFISMGYALYLSNRIPEAEAAFQKAFAAQKGYYKPYLDAGLLYDSLRNFELAEKYWLEAVRLGPGQTRARLNLAILYLNTGRLSEAEQYISDSLKIKKTFGALESLGELQLRFGRYAEAVDAYKEAVQVGPPSYKIWASLGLAYRRLNRRGDADRAFGHGLEEAKDGLADDPRDSERIAWIAFYHANLGEVRHARAFAAQAQAVGSGGLMGYTRKRLILTYGLLHDIDTALGLLKDAPSDMMKELDNSPELSPELRWDPRFVNLIR